MNNRYIFYQDRITAFENDIAQLKRHNVKLSAIRLFSVVGAFVGFYLLLPYSFLTAIILATICVVILIAAVIKYGKNSKNIFRLKRLVAINKNELSILNNEPNKLFSNGTEYTKKEHAYSEDLDILGEFSIYQKINRCVTKSGNDYLAKWLLGISKKEEIEIRQDAVKEYSKKINWRQDIMQYGIAKNLKGNEAEYLINWGKEKGLFVGSKSLKTAITALSVAAFIAIILAFISTFIPLLLLFFTSLGVHISQFKKVAQAHRKIAKKSDILNTYAYIIAAFEQQQWKAELLQNYQQKLGRDTQTTAQKIKQLSKLIELLDQRGNILVQLLINTLFFFELRLLFAIDKWLYKYGEDIAAWFDIIGQIEAVASIGNFSFNHPDWCFPEIKEEHFVLKMENAGHPLIPHEKRVCNDYSLTSGKIHIITGSNMAGKSTFLRTIGVNMVLALCGAPVCAKSMQTSVVEINTSMRIKDSIESNESSFYAELKRIKYVLEKVKNREKILLLLDEILRGTNSKDKHTGSEALIKQLVKYNAIGLVATHDLELSELENELKGKVENRFFDIKIKNDYLYFDYKIQKGVCNTFNAPVLMRKMGIEVK